MKNLWKELTPWIALGIVAWLFPYGYGVLIFICVYFVYLTVKLIKDERVSHKRE